MNGVVGGLLHPIADGERIIAPDRLTEIARGGELVVKTAVDDDIDAAPGLLAIDDAGDIDAAFSHDVAPEFDDDANVREAGPDRVFHQIGQVVSDRGKVEGEVLLEVWDPEAASEVQVANRP